MKAILTVLIFLVLSFNTKAQHTAESGRGRPTDNPELTKMYNDDQRSRSGNNIDWGQLEKDDSAREKRVYELMKEGKLVTGKDYHHSAMIFQHGRDSIAYGMAVDLMRKAVKLDSTISKWLLAAAIDRELKSKSKPQIYGTQYVQRVGEKKWERYIMDSTKVTDEERRAYGVQTLAQQQARLRIMNLASISDYYKANPPIENTLAFIENEKSNLYTSYNIDEAAVNSFGYSLLRAGKAEEALKVFTLNTRLYPKSWKVYDSLGDCFMKLNKRKEGLQAYGRSVELNPKNEHAIKVLSEYR